MTSRLSHAAPEVETGLAVDHIGVVVRDLAGEVARWRDQGFQVSEPVPLMGRDEAGRAVPLGQSSAHVVFDGSYVELSSPEAGSGNHLERYLALGDGVRILVLAADDAGAARAAIATRWPDVAPTREAARAIKIEGREDTARFSWFPLPFDVIPGVLSAVVAHRTPELVFHPSLAAHANGARRIERFVVTGRGAALTVPQLPASRARAFPALVCREAPGEPRLDAFVISCAADAPERELSLRFDPS